MKGNHIFSVFPSPSHCMNQFYKGFDVYNVLTCICSWPAITNVNECMWGCVCLCVLTRVFKHNSYNKNKKYNNLFNCNCCSGVWKKKEEINKPKSVTMLKLNFNCCYSFSYWCLFNKEIQPHIGDIPKFTQNSNFCAICMVKCWQVKQRIQRDNWYFRVIKNELLHKRRTHF